MMKITEIRVERFGVWHDLALPIAHKGVTVLYGPNEVGKSTLLDFLRGVLFGFDGRLRLCGHGLSDTARRAGPAATDGVIDDLRAGSLSVEKGGRAFTIHRRGQRGTHGDARVEGVFGPERSDEVITALLGGCDCNLFESVFAFGLRELQELATLTDDEVAGQIYGMTLGPEARRLLAAGAKLASERADLLADDGTHGRIAELLRRDRELAATDSTRPDFREQYRQSLRQRRELEARIEDMQNRRAGYHSQLKGHVFLERVHGPWKQVRECQDELARLPVVATFPENGLTQLAALETEIDSQRRCRNALLDEARRFGRQIDELPIDSKLLRRRGAVAALVEQQAWIDETRRGHERASERAATLRGEIDRLRESLGAEWNHDRLERVDVTEQAGADLESAAREFRVATARWKRMRNAYRRLKRAAGRREAGLARQSQPLNGRSIAEEMEQSRQRLADLHELARLDRQSDLLQQRRDDLDEQRRPLEEQSALPRWVYVVLAAFGVFGLIFGLTGLVLAATSSVLSGAAYLFIGATGAVSAWGLQLHFQQQGRERREKLLAELGQTDEQLAEVRRQIDRLRPPASTLKGADQRAGGVSPPQVRLAFANDATDERPFRPAAEHSLPPGDDAQIRAAGVWLLELERLAGLERDLHDRRRRLGSIRQKLQEQQRRFSEARHHWCQQLIRSGLSESVDVGGSLRLWRQIAAGRSRLDRLRDAVAERDRGAARLDAFRQRMTEIGRSAFETPSPASDLLQTLDSWKALLDEQSRRLEERRRLRREQRQRRREARSYARKLSVLKRRWSALLVQGGAATREEFEQRAEWLARRREFEELLELAQLELETAARTEPALAIVEEDLEAFDAEQNSDSLTMINLELEDLQRELQTAHEELGRLKQEITEIENDRRPGRLRCERARLAGELLDAAARWCAVEHVGRALGRARSRFERTCQPETLAAAARHLARLTGGRYTNVWAPLGERALRVDTAEGLTRTVEDLSGGTREQLLLAVRLATIDRLRTQGIELPLVLDDVLVNFDEERAGAALQALCEFTADGRQVLLLTCHRHLARLAEESNQHLITLPVQQMEQRRLAG